MGKRKSAKPQKYVQQSDEEEDDQLELYDAENEVENKQDVANPSSSSSETKVQVSSTNDEIENDANDICKEKYESMQNQSLDNNIWQNHIQRSLVDSSYKAHRNRLYHLGNSEHNLRGKASFLNHKSTPVFPEKFHSSQSYIEDRLSDGSQSMSVLNLSGTESDRKSITEFDSDHRGLRPKRRRKYVTYPATFRLEVVEHAEQHGKSAAAKKYNICVEKVSMWCKTKDNIVHKVKKGGFGFSDGASNDRYDDKMDDSSAVTSSDNAFDLSAVKVENQDETEVAQSRVSRDLNILYNDEDEEEEESEADSEKCEEHEIVRNQEVVFPAHFKLRVVQAAEEKGENAAAKEFVVCEERVHLWCQVKEVIIDAVKKQPAENWECDLYVKLKSSLEQEKTITVRDLILQAEKLQKSNPGATPSVLSTSWLTTWCQKFKVRFHSPLDSIPPPLTEDAYLMLETSFCVADKEETQALVARGKKNTRLQELIEESKKADASPSTSDREDSFSFITSSKRRRRSYTLAFKLEVVKFAQTHTKHATSRKYGIARRVISRWVADKEVLQNDLLHATQHVLGDSKLTEHVDSQLLKWYKEQKKKGIRVTKSMLCARADSIFSALGLNNVSASNGWYRHWVLKWKESGEDLHIVDDDHKKGSTPSFLQNNSTSPATPVSTDAHSSNNTPGSSLDALKQASLTNAILNSMQSTNPDWKVMSHFPELMNAIHCNNPSGISMTIANQMAAAAAAAAAANANIFPGCGSSLQAVADYCKEHDKNLNSVANLRNSFLLEGSSNNNNNTDKNKGPPVKKRRERYSPEFKLAVIEYATNHSYQETSRKFGVHHITVSEWCKDKERIKRKVYCESLHTKILKSETAEQKFLCWLQECNRQKIIIKPTDVQNKASEILNMIGEAEVKKNSWWFYLWNKRGLETEKFFEDEPDIDFLEKESRVNYPPAVKIEIAKIAERQSVNSAARCFRVARKRIREWVKTKDRLSWLAETGQVRERTSSLSGKKVNCLDADKEVYDWFKTFNMNDSTPKFSEVRAKALEIFQKYGFNNMKCSREWYKNWCKRYGIRTNSEKDDKLIKWVLTRYDENLPVTEHELLKFVSSITKKDLNSSREQTLAGYGKAFCRRFPKLFDRLPTIGETFPEDMERDIEKFRDSVQELQEESNFSLLCIGCMDEIPVSFVTSGEERKVVLNCGMDTCDAVVIMSCLADGTLLPPLIVLRQQHQPAAETGDTSFVLYKDLPLVDESTVRTWLEKVWLSSVPSPSLLVMDCFRPHTSSTLQEAISESGVTPCVMPAGCASKLQPLHVSIVKNFQHCIQDTWNRSVLEDSSSGNPITPSSLEIVRWITDAYMKLQYQREIVRRSFVMTGVALASDGSEDGLVENAEWFGSPNEEHVLSPLSTNGEESESEV